MIRISFSCVSTSERYETGSGRLINMIADYALYCCGILCEDANTAFLQGSG
jgi:hypothetical protein